MNKIKHLFLTAFSAVLLLFIAAPVSLAVGSDAPQRCGEIKTSLVDCNNDGGNPVVSLVLQVINFMAVGVGIAVVGGIIWGGLLYASSNGDSSKAKQGITAIVNSIIGLLFFMFMYALINFIVPGGIFS